MTARAGEPHSVPGWAAQLVAQGQDAIGAIAEDGTLVYVNPAAEQLLDVPRGSLLGSDGFALVHPEDLERVAINLTSMAAGARPLPGLIRLRHGDGRWVHYEVTASAIDLPAGDGPGPMTAVTIRDTSFQDAQWRFLTELSSGSDLHECFAVLAQGLSNATDGPMGIAYDHNGRRRSAGPLAPLLAGVLADGSGDLTPGTPWAAASRTGQPVSMPVSAIPEPFRHLGVDLGAAACVVVPVADSESDSPALIVQWPPHEAMAEVISHALVRRPRQAVTVALDRRDAQRRLEHLAHHDALTGLVNRSQFFALLSDLEREGRTFGVLYVDLDRFKPVNDRLGHVVGDHTLVVSARRMERAAGRGAVVGRLGGDEFAIAVADIDPTEPADLEARAARVVASLAEPFRIGEHLVQVGASVGVAATDGRVAADAVVAAADGALYAAKRAGRSTWRRAEVSVAGLADLVLAPELPF